MPLLRPLDFAPSAYSPLFALLARFVLPPYLPPLSRPFDFALPLNSTLLVLFAYSADFNLPPISRQNRLRSARKRRRRSADDGAEAKEKSGRLRRVAAALTASPRPPESGGGFKKSHHFWCESHQNAPLVLFLQLLILKQVVSKITPKSANRTTIRPFHPQIPLRKSPPNGPKIAPVGAPKTTEKAPRKSESPSASHKKPKSGKRNPYLAFKTA